MPSFQSRTIYQNLINADTGPLTITIIPESELSDHDVLLSIGLSDNGACAIGLAGGFSEKGKLVALAIASGEKILVLQLASSAAKQGISDIRKFLADTLFCRPTGFTYAFDMAPLALALWKDHAVRIVNGVDLQSACPKSRQPLALVKLATGNSDLVYGDNISYIFRDVIYPGQNLGAITPISQRAWLAFHVSQLSTFQDQLYAIPPINTTKFTDERLNLLAKNWQDAFRLDNMKPTEVSKQITTSWDPKKQQLRATTDRYQNRILARTESQRARVSVGGSDPALGYSVPVSYKKKSDAAGVNFTATNDLGGKVVQTLTIIGKDAPTAAEAKRMETLLHILQGLNGEDGNPWVQRVYDSIPGFLWPAAWGEEASSPIPFKPSDIPRPLNVSQIKAIRTMLSDLDDHRLTILWGPPGSGKTTVIASYVLTALAHGRRFIWLIAQSNVAVKNIAEKLVDFDLLNWKLLVSQDFFQHWHEHMYEKLRANVIISDAFCLPGLLQKELKSCSVVLCTLSMLSSPVLQRLNVFKTFPLRTLIIDEASQIEVGEYLSVFSSHDTIRKICFIGDDQQLPPYGQEDIQDLKSIFEVSHLKDDRILLDTQYRMPPQIGAFISEAIYSGLLESYDDHPITTDAMACRFVDVRGQEQSDQKSWKNTEECEAILQIAAHFESQKRSYRIITPYEAQRSLLEQGLKDRELSWGDKCFNVDSFQGNEDDYILISLVRTRALGFLSDLRRTNVMLTRCKRGMVICTSRDFLEGRGSESLVGNLLEYYGDEAWLEAKELQNMESLGL